MNLQKNKETLKDKAKTLSALFWENELEWSKWLRMGVTEHEAIKLSPKYQEKWVRLVDAEGLVRVKNEENKKLREDLRDCQTSWANLKNTIPKFDAKISYLEEQLKAECELNKQFRETLGQIREHIKNLNDWFVWYIYETTSSIKSVVFGYGNLVDSDNEIMDLILTLEELVGLFQEPKKEAKTE